MSFDRMTIEGWAACMALVSRLWPKCELSAETASLWERGLRHFDSSVVQEAIRDVATMYSYPTPTLARVLERAGEVQRQRRVREIQTQVQRRREADDVQRPQLERENADILVELRSTEPARLVRAARAAQRAMLFARIGPGVEAAERAGATAAGDKFIADNPDPVSWSERLRGLTWAALRDERTTAKFLGEVQEVTQR